MKRDIVHSVELFSVSRRYTGKMTKGVDIKDLKEKFSTIQSISQNLKEEKIRIESHLKTLESDYEEKTKEILEKTGKSSIKEAVEYVKERKETLENDMLGLEKELNTYLDTYGEDDE